jgi:lipopolysaccharide export system ATP-binding protein
VLPPGSTPRPSAPPALAVRGVSIALGDRRVLREVSISVVAGEILGVFGPSGAGKSTLFRAVAGELTPDRGEVLLDGKPLGRLPLWRRARLGLGYVPQGPSVLHDLSVLDNLRTFCALAGSGADPRALAEEVELSSRLGVRAAELSGGERRRLELARALLARPLALLCDEPFAGLSPAAIDSVARLLRARADRGLAVVVSDHHVAEALAVADRACLMLDGAIEVSCLADDFPSHPLVTSRYVTPHRPP